MRTNCPLAFPLSCGNVEYQPLTATNEVWGTFGFTIVIPLVLAMPGHMEHMHTHEHSAVECGLDVQASAGNNWRDLPKS